MDPAQRSIARSLALCGVPGAEAALDTLPRGSFEGGTKGTLANALRRMAGAWLERIWTHSSQPPQVTHT